MSKLILRLDSHQLSAFQRCPRQFYWNYKRHKESKANKSAFMRGNAIHDFLYHFYGMKIKKHPFKECVDYALHTPGPTNPEKITYDLIENATERLLILRKLAEYSDYYRSEVIKPVAVEIGFAKTIYEDDHYLFIYEGKIDFVAELERNRYSWVDHKTQAYKYELIPDVNQFMGYCWAIGYNTGMINFIGLQESYKPKDSFHRSICTYPAQLIEEWRQMTVRSFFKLAALIQTNSQIGAYDKVRTSCQQKYGKCEYLPLCHETSLNVIEGMAAHEFKERIVWTPWE